MNENQKKRATDQDLDAFFDAARNSSPEPSPEFLARILSDAEGVQNSFVQTPFGARKPAKSVFAQLRDAIGGWPALGGLVTASAVGVWIGISPPESVTETMAAFLGDSTEFIVDPLSGFELASIEG